MAEAEVLMRAVTTGLLLSVALAGCGGSTAPPAPPPVPVFGAQAGFPRVSAEIIDWLLARDPVHATSIGEHAHDTTLGAHFPGDLERARLDARALLTRLAQINRPTLERPQYFDHRVLEHALRAELLDLEVLGGWQRDPVRYVDLVSRGTIGLLDPALGLDPEGAVQSLAARWSDVPLVFRAARQNLDAQRVPALAVREATARANELGSWFGSAHADAWRASISAEPGADRAMQLARASIDSFTVWLADLAPRTTGGFRLGSEALRSLIEYRHHVDLPLAEIDALNRQALTDYREWMDRVALDLDPLRPPEAIVDSMVAARTDEWQLLPPVMSLGAATAATRARRAAPPAGFGNAWAHYMDLAAVENESTPNADRLAALRRAIHAHALLHATLQLHAGSATLDEVALQLESQAFLPREAARAEAERVARDPLYGMIAFDRMLIFALRDVLRAERAGEFDEQRFAQELLDLRLPVPLAAEALLGREPDGLLVPGRRTPGVPEPPSVLD